MKDLIILFLFTNFATYIVTTNTFTEGMIKYFIVVNILLLISAVIYIRTQRSHRESVDSVKFLVLEKEVVIKVLTQEESERLEYIVEKVRNVEGSRTFVVDEVGK